MELNRPAGRRKISTPDAPAPAASYSQGVEVGNTIYVAGQIGLDPAGGGLVSGGIEAEGRRVLDNLTAVLRAAGASLADVTAINAFLTRVEDFSAYNAVYASYFSGEMVPVRTTVVVKDLPLGACVEINAIAHRDPVA